MSATTWPIRTDLPGINAFVRDGASAEDPPCVAGEAEPATGSWFLHAHRSVRWADIFGTRHGGSPAGG